MQTPGLYPVKILSWWDRDRSQEPEFSTNFPGDSEAGGPRIIFWEKLMMEKQTVESNIEM